MSEAVDRRVQPGAARRNGPGAFEIFSPRLEPSYADPRRGRIRIEPDSGHAIVCMAMPRLGLVNAASGYIRTRPPPSFDLPQVVSASLPNGLRLRASQFSWISLSQPTSETLQLKCCCPRLAAPALASRGGTGRSRVMRLSSGITRQWRAAPANDCSPRNGHWQRMTGSGRLLPAEVSAEKAHQSIDAAATSDGFLSEPRTDTTGDRELVTSYFCISQRIGPASDRSMKAVACRPG